VVKAYTTVWLASITMGFRSKTSRQAGARAYLTGKFLILRIPVFSEPQAQRRPLPSESADKRWPRGTLS